MNSEATRHLENILAAIHDIVFVMDRDGRHSAVYGSWVRESGLTDDHYLGKTFAEVLGADAAVVHERALRRALRGESVVYMWTVPGPASLRHFQTSLSPVLAPDGGVEEVVGLGRDITDLAVARQHVEDRERLLSHLLAQVPGAIYQYCQYTDGSSSFPFASDNIWLVYEVTPEQVRSDAAPVFERIHPDDRDAFATSIAESAHTLRPWELDHRVVLPRRGLRWLRGRATPHRRDDGSILWHGFITDITDLKEVELDLRESDARWRAALDGAGDGVWDWNAVTNVVYYSPQWKAMLGYRDDELEATIDVWHERIHPDDVEMVDARVGAHLRGETPSYRSEHRVRHRDGHWIWILDRGAVAARDADGRALRVIGTHVDIDQRRHMEEEAQRLNAEKDVLLKEVHHRVKNSFAAVEALVRMQSMRAQNPEIQTALNDVQSRITSQRVLYDRLLQTQSYDTVDSRAYLSDLASGVAAVYAGRLAGSVALETTFVSETFDARTMFAVGAIMVELMTNSYKHAFPEGRDGTIRVSLDREEPAGLEPGAGSATPTIVLVVGDDGVGIEAVAEETPAAGSHDEHGTSFGTSLVAIMARQLGGTTEVDAAPRRGVRTVVRFPPGGPSVPNLQRG